VFVAYFLLAPEYYLPDPGMDVDLRSMFFFGAHCGNCAEGSSGWRNAFLDSDFLYSTPTIVASKFLEI
jgi:hypothetical protein